MTKSARTNKLDVCKTCGKEVAASAKKCPHCGESYPALARAALNKKIYKVIGAGFLGLIVIAAVGGSMTETRITQNDHDPVVKQNVAMSEAGLDGGYANIRVLSNAMLQQLKIEALANGKSPAGLYPTNGPIAFIQLPVQSLNLDQLGQVYPLLCKKTVHANPELWQSFSDVRILNKFSYVGFSFDLYTACQYPNKRMIELVGSVQIGKWSAQIPFELASTMNTIGYGSYR